MCILSKLRVNSGDRPFSPRRREEREEFFMGKCLKNPAQMLSFQRNVVTEKSCHRGVDFSSRSLP